VCSKQHVPNGFHATCQRSFLCVQCHRPGKLLPLIDLLYRLSLSSNASLTHAVQRLQSEVIQVITTATTPFIYVWLLSDVGRRIVQALQLSVPQIPEHQQQQLDALRQRWLDAVQGRSRSGQLFLQDVARWLSGAGVVWRSDQSRHQKVCLYAITAACNITCCLMCGSLQGQH